MKNLEKYIRKYRGVPFKLGGLGMDGLDCIGLLYRFYTDMGVEMPDSVGEANKDNYAQICDEDKSKTAKLLTEYFDLFGEEVSPMEVMSGDAIIIRHGKTKRLFPAIYGGNGIAIAVFLNSCARTFSVGGEAVIVKARRVL